MSLNFCIVNKHFLYVKTEIKWNLCIFHKFLFDEIELLSMGLEDINKKWKDYKAKRWLFSKHRPSGQMLFISWSVRMFVCVSVCLSVTLSHKKWSKIWKLLLIKGVKSPQRKKFFLNFFFIFSLCLNVFLPPLTEVQCHNFLDILFSLSCLLWATDWAPGPKQTSITKRQKKLQPS